MADDATIKSGTAGSDIRMATDEAAFDGVNQSHAQLVKLVSGTADSTTRVAAAAGTAANALRTTLASDDPAVVSVQIIDDWDESDRAKVNIIAGVAGVTAGAGAVAAGTPRVTLASDDPGVASLATVVTNTNNLATILTSLQLIDDVVFAEDVAANAADKGLSILAVRRDADTSLVDATNDYAQLQVDARGALKVEVFSGETLPVSAGTNLNTSLLALEAGGNLAAIATSLAIIDDWDTADRCAVNLIVGQAGVAAGAGAVGVTVPRVTLASDDPAVASLSVLDDWDETDRAKVNVIVGVAGITAGAGAVAAGTPRMTLASDDPAVASLASLVAQGLADNGGFTDGTSKVLPAGFIYDEVAGTVLTENDVAAARVNLNRAQVGIIEDGVTRGRWATVTAANALTVDTELPAAAALSNAFANPTAPGVGAFGMIWNGATWDRIPGTLAGGTLVQGPVAHDAAVTSAANNPLLLGALADTDGDVTAVSTDGDVVRLVADLQGRLVVRPLKFTKFIVVNSANLTTSTTAYTAGDVLGMANLVPATFASAARVSAGSGVIRGIYILDKADITGILTIFIYRASITLPADNAAWGATNPTDTEAESLILRQQISMTDEGNHHVGFWSGYTPFDCAASDLFVGMRTDTAHTFFGAASDIRVKLWIEQD